MAGTDVVDLLEQTRRALKEVKRERAAAMDAIVDLVLERAALKAVLKELADVVDTRAYINNDPDVLAVVIKAKDILGRV